MRKFTYYLCCILIWFATLLTIALLLVFCGIMPFVISWGYSTGGAMGHPQLWLISWGITLLFRHKVYKTILRENHDFSDSTGIALIICGAVWLLLNIGKFVWAIVVGIVGIMFYNFHKHKEDPDVMEASLLGIPMWRYYKYKKASEEISQIYKELGTESKTAHLKVDAIIKNLPNMNEWRRYSEFQFQKTASNMRKMVEDLHKYDNNPQE